MRGHEQRPVPKGHARCRSRQPARSAAAAFAWSLACPCVPGCGSECYTDVLTAEKLEGSVTYTSATRSASGLFAIDVLANKVTFPAGMAGNYSLTQSPGGSLNVGFRDSMNGDPFAGVSLNPLPSPGTYALSTLGACLSGPCTWSDAGIDGGPPACNDMQACLPIDGTLVVSRNSVTDCQADRCTSIDLCNGQACPPICAWNFDAQITFSSVPGGPFSVSASLTVEHHESVQHGGLH